MIVLQHWGGHWKVQGREGDQRLLGEGLSEEREANLYQYFSGQVDGNQENLSSLPWNFGTIE